MKNNIVISYIDRLESLGVIILEILKDLILEFAHGIIVVHN